MAERGENPHRVVIYAQRADFDFSNIHESTAAVWGFEQAERYADLLEETASGIADGTIEGKALIGGHPEVRAYFVRWHKAKHGHYIIYRASENGGIYVLRILHGRMDLPKYL